MQMYHTLKHLKLLLTPSTNNKASTQVEAEVQTQVATKREIEQEREEVVQIEVAIMEIMVDNQGNQVTITIKTTQLEVLKELLLNINVPFAMEIMVT